MFSRGNLYKPLFNIITEEEGQPKIYSLYLKETEILLMAQKSYKLTSWGEVGSWNPIIYRVLAPSKRWLALGFLNHQQYWHHRPTRFSHQAFRDSLETIQVTSADALAGISQSLWRGLEIEQWTKTKNPGSLGYIGDYLTTQLCEYYLINHEIRIPTKQAVFHVT